MTALQAPLARYAARFHAAAGDSHHVGSPLGAWLLAALCAPAARGRVADDLAEALGVDLATARTAAEALLTDPHPAVLSAAALWLRDPPTPAVADWIAALPSTVTTGELPGQAALDAWAERKTLGLIRKMPATVDPTTLLLLATALATKVSWVRPFQLAPAARLGSATPWAAAVSEVLVTPDDAEGHGAYVATVPGIGEVAVHTGVATEGLRVTSVIAPADTPAADVLAAAHDLATRPRAARTSLFDLPLGDAPLWTITEERVRTTAPDGREERVTAVLPAWSATTEHDLDRPELGLPAAAAAASEALGNRGPHSAVQSAMARYSRVGFEAAAVSAMMRAAGMPMVRDGVRRTAELRFAHPYAVVAVADRPWAHGWQPPEATGTPWLGLPVFSAWVATPDDAAGQ